ncbi:voltage-dependent calcium channel beta subunit-associated regulatory protein isoform X4 [Mustela putorius furo]|uniref:Voltage-dependent calcium channel beta subunit-associated regulatory protein isoform X4 n=1 Tax=Mustela putorius furo TaxID=9669 RepID=A0A8U0SJI4_MUSPF|nr:voltage-dependent calcium channel beta subunit-associated regulatory protein isoform X4 [Mustela putorius furo]
MENGGIFVGHQHGVSAGVVLMSPGAGQAMVALSTGHILLSLLAVCPNKTQGLVNLAVPHIKEEKGGAYIQPHPPDCASWGLPGWGRRRRGNQWTGLLPLVPRPSGPWEGSVAVSQGRAWGLSHRRESRSAWGGGVRERRLRLPLPPEGKGRRWPARREPDAAASAAGAVGPGPGGTQRVGAGSPPTRSRAPSLLLRLPPPRAALSIHKFSACSAATGHRSPPGTPRSRPPARPPWAARPGAEAPPPSFKMQPTPTMATAAGTAATVALTSRWDNATGTPTVSEGFGVGWLGRAGPQRPRPAVLTPAGPQAEPDPILDNYVLLVVVMSLFVGGTLVVLSGVLLVCRRCWEAYPRFNRATEEADKTATTYLDNGARPAQDPDFRGEDPEGQDAETERFLSTSSTGRRVSFNEAALFEQSRKSQDKGRRSSQSTSATWAKLAQPPLPTLPRPPRPTSPSSSSALPGDPYNSAVGPADFEISPLASSDSGEGTWVRAPERPLPSLPHSRTELDPGTRSSKPAGPGPATGHREAGRGEAGPGSGAGPVLQFFTRLRRHASLDGASPYFKVKKWKLDPSQRASSLDTRGSPKRHQFQRQRAASESTEQEEGDAPHGDFIQYIASAGAAVAFPPPRPFLASPTSPSPTLGRLEAAEEVGAAGGASPESPPESSGGVGPEQLQQQESDGERDSGPEQAQTSYRDIWSLRASLELHAAAASDHSSSGNDRDSVRSGDSSGSGSGTTAPAFPPPSPPPTPRSADGEAGGPRKLLQMDSGYASIEGRGAGDDGLPSASEKRSSFTSAGRTATVGSSFEGALAPTEAPARPRSPRAWPRRAPRRDYSIDEKTDALFHEFLRHDPHFDDALPCAARHRARAHPHPHARKQWQQRGRQHSDPGARAAPPAPPAPPFRPDPRPPRAPLRRGDSVDCPSEGRAGEDPAAPAIPVIEEEPGGGGGGGGGCPGSGLCVEPPGTLLDKLAAGLDDRLFPPRLAQPIAAAPALAAAAPTSPDHSPA